MFFVLLGALPIAAGISQGWALFDTFYRSGSLVFGGGHVVLPLLHAEVVAPGWVSNDEFLAGYSAAQSVPGPLSTFAAYLGAVVGPVPNGIFGAGICLIAVLLPVLLLLVGALPFWDSFRRKRSTERSATPTPVSAVGHGEATMRKRDDLADHDYFYRKPSLSLRISCSALSRGRRVSIDLSLVEEPATSRVQYR